MKLQQTIQSISAFISIIFLCGIASQSSAFIYHWEIDETPEGSESATIIEPVEVTLLDEQIQVPSHSASLALMRKYSVIELCTVLGISQGSVKT